MLKKCIYFIPNLFRKIFFEMYKLKVNFRKEIQFIAYEFLTEIKCENLKLQLIIPMNFQLYIKKIRYIILRKGVSIHHFCLVSICPFECGFRGHFEHVVITMSQMSVNELKIRVQKLISSAISSRKTRLELFHFET